MIIKKGLLTVILLTAITANSANAAIINEPLGEEVLTDTSKKITISGTIPLADDNNEIYNIVTLEVLTKEASQQIINSTQENKYDLIDEYVIDKNKIEYIAQTEADENGNYSFEFVKTSESGDYIIRIGYYAKNDENEYVITYNYKSPEDLIGLFDEMEQAYNAKNKETLKEVLNKYSESDVINIEKWNEITASGDEGQIDFVLGYMLNQTLPESEAEIEQYIEDASLIEELNKKTVDEVKAVLEQEEKRKEFGIDETVYAWMMSEDNTEVQDTIFKKLSGKNMENMSVEDVTDLIHYTIVFEELNGVLWTNILKVIENNNTVLNIDLSEQSEFEGLNETQQDEALKDFKSSVSKAVEIEDIKEIFDRAVEDAKDSGGGTGGGTQGGPGGGSGTGSSDSRNESPSSSGSIISYPSGTIPNTSNTGTNTEDESSQAAFNDIEDVAWAAEAITRLKEKGVLAGNGDGSFKPQDPVTREEFLKMVIEALALKNESEDVSFSDVDKNSWYYPYICGGVYYKLINGMEDGSFGIGQSIKRADVAVILVRLLKMYGKEYTWKSIVYKDVIKEELEYAYDAIYSVSEARLMTGTGDVTFEPFKSLTRAEAAVIIDRVITLLENN